VRLLVTPAETHNQPVYACPEVGARCDTQKRDLPSGLPGADAARPQAISAIILG
jgi:hypothetical protein